MLPKDDLNRRRHSVSALHVHLVFVTKYRRKVFDRDALNRIKKLFADICLQVNADLVEMDGERDHVHLLVRYPPALSIGTLVRRLKGATSRLLRLARPDIAQRFRNGVLWSPSYFATSCGGAPIAVIRQYIEQKDSPIN
jgi:putative transposase